MDTNPPTELAPHTFRDHRQPATHDGTTEVHRRTIEAPLAGLELDDADERLLAWLASWDCDIVDGVGRLLHRARRAGREDAAYAPRPSLRAVLRDVPAELEDDILRCLESFQRVAGHRAVRP